MLHALAARSASEADVGLGSTATEIAAAWSTNGATRSSPTDRRDPGARPLEAAPELTRGGCEVDGVFARIGAEGARRQTDYWKTGHSYIKRRVTELRHWGLRKSGHFFFNAPIGRGYDDGILTGIQVIEMLDAIREVDGRSLPGAARTWGTPTNVAPLRPTEVKY